MKPYIWKGGNGAWFVEHAGKGCWGVFTPYAKFTTWREAIDYVMTRWNLASTVID